MYILIFYIVKFIKINGYITYQSTTDEVNLPFMIHIYYELLKKQEVINKTKKLSFHPQVATREVGGKRWRENDVRLHGVGPTCNLEKVQGPIFNPIGKRVSHTRIDESATLRSDRASNRSPRAK